MPTVRITGSVNTTIEVSPNDSIRDGLNSIGLSDHQALFNGTVLFPSLSFAFYNIKDNDIILLVKNKESSKSPPMNSKPKARHLSPADVQQLKIAFNQRFGHNLKDPDNVFEYFKNSLDPVYSREVGRTNDLFRQRIEAVPSIFRKIYKRFNNLSSQSHNSDDQLFPTVLPEKALEPSTELLPVLTVPIDTTS